MNHLNFRLDVYGEPTDEQEDVLFRRVMPADDPTWLRLSDDGADPVGPVADRMVVGSVVGDDRQPGAAVAGLVSLIWYDVPTDEASAFEDWFAQEHAPILLREPAWLRCRRVRVAQDTAGSDVTHLVVHELADRTALSSPHMEAARATPARADMAARPWFAANVMELFEREAPAGATS
ncbi:hypothetical protein [Aeromicrobium choanae]|uniref:EthD domain-containing protein n=1 Tax=Aeromicrobium choanae TaxID=1736691 RepID=A0A1T4Z4B8_9ACTN|nr:hypothetical protein [Aeromicrobium choanae]SKB08917.1 hypothetical protein SAMN06295964_2394 [Aeromicrobium choanae]